MTEENRRRNLAPEVERATSALRAAEVLLQAGLWDDAVSRAYYSCFHFVQALLFSAGLEARSHGGLHDSFFLHYVRTGAAPARLAKLFAGLQRYREQADYARAFRFDEAGAREEVGHAREIAAWVRARLESDGFLPPPDLAEPPA